MIVAVRIGVGLRHVTPEIQIYGMDRTDPVFLDQRLDGPHRREETIVLADHQNKPFFRRQFRHLAGFLYRGRERLFSQNVPPGL